MDTSYRQTGPLMRFALFLGAALTFVSGVQLFVLTDRTEDLFAWTIAAGSSATVMGAFYWTACALSFSSWRRQPWAYARVGVPGVMLFLWATLFATLAHLDRFHFSGSATGRIAAWVWLVVYVADPILVTIAAFVQWRTPGADPPRASPLSSSYRFALIAFGLMFTALGLAMLLVPKEIMGVSAWPLTPLTSRAIGSWVLAMGVVFATMDRENDAIRIQPATVACLILPALLLIGMVRYWDQFKWNGVGWVYPALIAVVAALGLAGVLASRKPAPIP